MTQRLSGAWSDYDRVIGQLSEAEQDALGEA